MRRFVFSVILDCCHFKIGCHTLSYKMIAQVYQSTSVQHILLCTVKQTMCIPLFIISALLSPVQDPEYNGKYNPNILVASMERCSYMWCYEIYVPYICRKCLCVIHGYCMFSSLSSHSSLLNRTLSNPSECVMCSDNPVQVTFKPCGHRIACHACGQRMKKCFVCKCVLVQGVARQGSNCFFRNHI